MQQDSLRIDLLGTSFSIKTDQDQFYLQQIISKYTRFVEETKQKTGLTDPLKIAIIAGIVLCDELEKNRSALNTTETKETERIALDLIARLDEAIKG